MAKTPAKRSPSARPRPRPTGSTDPGSFQLGDRVTWSSQAAGSWKTKLGTIVEVVPKGRVPAKTETISSRNHESYIIEARDPLVAGTKMQLYWPIVSRLKRVRKAKVTHVALVDTKDAPAGCTIYDVVQAQADAENLDRAEVVHHDGPSTLGHDPHDVDASRVCRGVCDPHEHLVEPACRSRVSR